MEDLTWIIVQLQETMERQAPRYHPCHIHSIGTRRPDHSFPSNRIKQFFRYLTYPLLGELTSTLVLSVSQKFDNTTLIGGETGDLLDDLPDESSALGEVALGTADAALGGLVRSGFL